MPKRTDLHKIMVIGSGPIVIGQACEFDYSGTQAVKALKEEGYKVILVNSNPATIMTDPGLADQTYIEPIDQEHIEAIIKKERPDAILPTLGGQTALNAALALAERGILQQYGVELLGADADVIAKAESRELFRDTVNSIGLKMPESAIARNMDEVRKVAETLPFPLILRPAFTLGGAGGGVAYNAEDLEAIASQGLAASIQSEILVEQSVLGWKEIEIEMIRDTKDNCIVVCTIENLDPMGVHTGDSITVAPAVSLTDAEIESVCSASREIMRAVGMKGGGANIQYAMHPTTSELVVIEMNPRVSRSSALASKATGFPIAHVSAKLAVGYTLDEITNTATGAKLSEYDPSINYIVAKIPRFTFEKFPGAKDELTTSMKSVGEAMSIGKNFQEVLQKGLRSMEIGAAGLGINFGAKLPEKDEIMAKLRTPNSMRIFYVRWAMQAGLTNDEIYEASAIDYWFLREIRKLVDMEDKLKNFALQNSMDPENNPELKQIMLEAKEYSFSDKQLGEMWKMPETEVRRLRGILGVKPNYQAVLTAAGSKDTRPYFYSTHTPLESKYPPSNKKKIVILGGGPNRIGQGIEFDYCCTHAAYALKDMGVESIMINSNPETVSTDYDTSDRLYFEPLTYEDVMAVISYEKPDGVIVQFGGQTPLNLAVPLMRAGVKIIGTSPDAIDRAEDRERFQALLQKLDLRQPPNGTAMTLTEAKDAAEKIGYPVVVRPSYVLGGRSMVVAYDEEQIIDYFANTLKGKKPEHPILIDKFLENATEVDVDALCDGDDTYVAGIMEHIEEAGIHSGDSACVLPPHTLSEAIQTEITRQTKALAKELRVVGLMNIQFAIKDGQIFILEVNPRASRTVPFVSKATGVQLAKLATRVMMGEKLKDLAPAPKGKGKYVAVKEAVFPFKRFPGVDILLGPEMRSTGEVMGIAPSVEEAFMKAQNGAGQKLPDSGKVFISVNERDKPFVGDIAKLYSDLGFEILATSGTASLLKDLGIDSTVVFKVYEGRPNIVDLIKNGEIAMIINSPSGKHTVQDSKAIRQNTLLYEVPYSTTMSGAKAQAEAIADARKHPLNVRSIQDYYN